MRKQLIISALFFTSITLFCQERHLLTGKILLEEYSISDVHIQNKNTHIGTISNDKGFFEIPVKVGDSLYFSHINLDQKLLIISEIIDLQEVYTVQLTDKTYALDEIILEKPRSIFYVDPEIMPNNGPIVNAKTLNLPYANIEAKKDEKITKITFTSFKVNLDNLINSINGNNKRQKLAEKLAKEDSDLLKIRAYFTDDFFVTDLKIKKEYINPFLNYCMDKRVIAAFKNKNKIEVTKLLLEVSKEFPYKIENEDLYLTKN